jgi:serine protease Do
MKASNLRHNRARKSSLVSIIAVLFFLGASTFPGIALATGITLGNGEAPVKIAPDSPVLALQDAFIEVAAKVSPAVVNISSEWTESVQGFNGMDNMDEFFNFFYGQRGMGQRPRQDVKRKQRSLGSGFLITSDGYILTNAHVIGKAEKVTVTFEDGTTYPAKIIGKDEKIDIGVVKITETKHQFPHLVLGDSDHIKVGQWSIAVGNPFALDHTVTTGVISAKGRNVEVSQESGYQNYIQTDASINPGNSGGPLCNISGEVIGINSAIYSQSGGSVGIGFAIPSNIARKAAEDLINEGKVIRAGLGAVIQSLSPKMAKSFGLSSTEGALISNINTGSAAEKAGLKPGDIILDVNDEKVISSGDLVAKLYTYKPGAVLQLTVLRGGVQSQIPVTLQALDENNFKVGEKLATPDEQTGDQNQNQNLGLALQDQTPEIKSQLPAGAPKGPVVVQVDPQGPAAAAGLRQGDIILKVGNTALYSAKQLSAVLQKTDLKSGARLFVWRNGVTLYAFLQTGDE